MASHSTDSREPVSYNESEIAYGKVVLNKDGSIKQAEAAERVVMGAEDRSAMTMPAAGVVPNCASAARVTRNAKYRVAALVYLSIALITVVVSVIISVKVLIDCNNFRFPNSDSPALYVIVSFIMYMLVLAECLVSLIAAITLIVKLARRPDHVLLSPAYGNGKHSCLCASVFLLFLFSAFSFSVPLFLGGLKQYPEEPMAFCIVPAFRMVSWLALFVTLICYRSRF